ncbi:MAG: AMP-binding protein, partial [Pseudomonadota bacterium]|nr:AMP-binding protein [Pseudomonadota bacterium]
MRRFMALHGFDDYSAFHRWSIENAPKFWQAMAEFGKLEFRRPARKVFEQPGEMTTATFFADAEISFPEHVLRYAGDRAAIVFRGENGVRREISFDDLRRRVAEIASGLRELGVTEGDRVAAFLPNCPEAIVAMLAVTSIGAIWSSCSPDFGINGVVDRFGQIGPKVLFTADGYWYNGKQHDSLAPVRGVLEQIDSIETTVIVPFLGKAVDADELQGGRLWEDLVVSGAQPLYRATAFNHPLYIMYSSGTTGV